jgi:hypothetical protein
MTPELIKRAVIIALHGARIGVGEGRNRDVLSPEQVAEVVIHVLNSLLSPSTDQLTSYASLFPDTPSTEETVTVPRWAAKVFYDRFQYATEEKLDRQLLGAIMEFGKVFTVMPMPSEALFTESLQARVSELEEGFAIWKDRALNAEATVDTLCERAAELEEALKPFVRHAKDIVPTENDSAPLRKVAWGPHITVGTFRRARDVYERSG